MAFDGAGSGNEQVTGINVTPLVDVVLVLLVVLMVAASGAISEALPIDLPSASAGDQSEPTVLRVAIAQDGRLSVDGRATDLEDVRRTAEQSRSADPNVRAAIAADGGARHEQVVAVLDALRTSGVTRLAIQVTPRKP